MTHCSPLCSRGCHPKLVEPSEHCKVAISPGHSSNPISPECICWKWFKKKCSLCFCFTVSYVHRKWKQFTLVQLRKGLNSLLALVPCGFFYSIRLASLVTELLFVSIWHLKRSLAHPGSLIPCTWQQHLTFGAVCWPSFPSVSHSICIGLAPRGTLRYFSFTLVLCWSPLRRTPYPPILLSAFPQIFL